MQGRADTGARLAALALAWLVGIALQLQQPEGRAFIDQCKQTVVERWSHELVACGYSHDTLSVPGFEWLEPSA